MNNLKVVFLCENMFGNPYQELLIKSLNSQGVEVKEDFCNVIFLPKIIKEKPNAIHLQTLHYYFLGQNQLHRLIKFFIFISQVFILKLIGVKIVWTVHEWNDRFEGGKRNLSQIQSAIIGKLFHAVIAHCETTKKEITKALSLENQDRDKVFVIRHGNYIGYFQNKINQREARKTLNILPDNLVFLLFGSIHRTKGFMEAIDAFKRLQENKISLLVVGHPSEENLEELIKDKIKDYENIIFVPRRINDNEIQIYMNACDCVVFPYKVFTTSGAVILAISFGKACIAPQLGYFNDVLDERGAFFYDSSLEDSLMQAMKQVIEKKNELPEMGKHNLKLAEPWSWNYVAEETIKIYQK
ncbi:MAG: glycosyltransferase family 4 protein [Potamolinea sp.]